jgi:hypothetical protein
MVLGRFAYLKPLPKPLVSRTLTLRVDHFPGELTLQLKRTPRLVSGDMLGLESQQEQIYTAPRKHGYDVLYLCAE